jgi:hypothetical protein
MPAPETTQEILQERLVKAQERLREATANFQKIISSVPSGIPHPDGSLRIKLASTEHKAAMENYTDAVTRLTNFAFNVPPKDAA